MAGKQEAKYQQNLNAKPPGAISVGRHLGLPMGPVTSKISDSNQWKPSRKGGKLPKNSLTEADLDMTTRVNFKR